MAESVLETAVATQYITLLTFNYGASSVSRYCKYTKDITLTDAFTSDPSIQLKWRKMHGGVKDTPLEITLSTKNEPMLTLATAVIHSPVVVTIEEADPSDAATRRVIYKGTVSEVKINPNKKAALITLTLETVKARLETKLGALALKECDHIFGSPDCGINIPNLHTHPCTIDDVGVGGNASRLQLTLDTPISPSGDLDNQHFRRGYVEVDGLRILIRKLVSEDVADNQATFDMVRIPPPSWDGGAATGTVIKGCDKRRTTCKNTYNNERHFRGMGIRMPKKNPVFHEG